MKRMYLGAIGLLLAAPMATHAETLQQVTDQGNSTTNSIHVDSASADTLFESSALYLHGTYGTGNFAGYPTKILISSPDGNYWNDMYQNETANASSEAPAQWGHYVADDGDFQIWSTEGESGAAHQYLTFVTPEQEVAWATGGPGGVYMPEAGMTFSPFQSNTNDLGLPIAAWRNLYAGGVNATSVSAVYVTSTKVATDVLEVKGPSGLGSFDGFPAKFVITSPSDQYWTSIQQNASANANHPTTAEAWGTFVGNDGSFMTYAANSDELFAQYITQAQLTEQGSSELGGLYVGPAGGTLSPSSNNDIMLGQADDSWKNIYASGTVFTVGLTVSSQARLPSDTMINNTLVCLADGTNCPSMFMAQAQQIQPPAAKNDDIDGQAKIVKNGLEVDVTFAKAFANAPAVLVTPREFIDGAYRVTNVKKGGFTIEFSKKQSKDVQLDWHASGIEVEKMFVGVKAK